MGVLPTSDLDRAAEQPVALADPLVSKDAPWRAARAIAQVFESAVIRSPQGYGNFAAPDRL